MNNKVKIEPNNQQIKIANVRSQTQNMGLSIIKEEVDEIVMDCDYFMEKEGI